MNETSLPMTVLAVVRELHGGGRTAQPVASLPWWSSGPQCESELALYLGAKLATVEPDALDGLVVPESARLVQVDVQLVREELPRRVQIQPAFSFACVVIGDDNASRWVIVLALEHTFHVADGEDLLAAVQSEVQRLVAASDPKPLDWLRLLPAYSYRLEKLRIEVERPERLDAGRAASLRQRLIDASRRKDALEVLDSVAKRVEVRKPILVGREAEQHLFGQLLGGASRISVLLIGPDSSGKTALVHAIAAGGRRVYQTSASQLLAGMSGFGQWQARVRRVMLAAETLDAVIFFEDLADLFAEHEGGKIDLAAGLRPFVEEGRVRLVGEITTEALDRAESRQPGFFAAMSRLQILPLSPAQTVEALSRRAEDDARRGADSSRPLVELSAVQALVDLCERYLPYRSFPGKAMRLYHDLLAFHAHDRTPSGEPVKLGKSELFALFSLQTGIPQFLLRDERVLLLDEVITALQQRVIGQSAAVRRVAETVCVVKAGLMPTGRPLGNFLFVGPTGVGKTELARALAGYLFGSDERLLRFDMSEFMDLEAADRLIRGSAGQEGLLTRRVREQPFCVLLLDEIEKAHPAVFDLLLQLMGDGRLTDSRGRTASFVNTILIMTSNLGAAERKALSGFVSGAGDGDGDEAYFRAKVDKHFRPEFVNRLDRVVPFGALGAAEASDVTRLFLKKLVARRGVLGAGVELTVSEPALAKLAEGGTSVTYGARALRRHLEDKVAAPAARLLAVQRGVKLHVSLSDETFASDTDPVAQLDEDGILLRLYAATAKQTQREVRSLEELSKVRRDVDATLHLPRAAEVGERLEWLSAQLGQGGRQRGRAAQLAEMQVERARLDEPWQEAKRTQDELVAAEELALTALLVNEPMEFALGEATRLGEEFHRTATALLLALEPRRDKITLLVQEPDDSRALDIWFPSLVAALDMHRWTLTVHVDGVKPVAGENWPTSRRWSPPRDAEWLLKNLKQKDRSPRSLVLCVNGPLAHVLCLLGGLTRYTDRDGGDAHLMIHRIAPRIILTDEEWLRDELKPAIQPSSTELRAAPATLLVQERSAVIGYDPARRASQVWVPTPELFTRFWQVARAILTNYDLRDELDRDQLFTCRFANKVT